MLFDLKKQKISFTSLKSIFGSEISSPIQVTDARTFVKKTFTPYQMIIEMFNSSELKDSFYSYEIFVNEIGDDIKDVTYTGSAISNEKQMIDSLNFILFMISISNPEKIENTIEEACKKYADKVKYFCEKWLSNFGYRLQKHTDANIYLLVPTELKEVFTKGLEDFKEKEDIFVYYSFSGNLEKKRDILRKMWLPFEAIRSEYEKTFKGSCSDIARVSNKYGIRHLDDSGIPNNIKDDEKMIEYHYDHLFHLFIIAFNYMKNIEK